MKQQNQNIEGLKQQQLNTTPPESKYNETVS